MYPPLPHSYVWFELPPNPHSIFPHFSPFVGPTVWLIFPSLYLVSLIQFDLLIRHMLPYPSPIGPYPAPEQRGWSE